MTENEFRGEVAQLVKKQIHTEVQKVTSELKRAEASAAGTTGGILDQVSQVLADHENQKQLEQIDRARIETAIGLQVERDGSDLAVAK